MNEAILQTVKLSNELHALISFCKYACFFIYCYLIGNILFNWYITNL